MLDPLSHFCFPNRTKSSSRIHRLLHAAQEEKGLGKIIVEIMTHHSPFLHLQIEHRILSKPLPFPRHTCIDMFCILSNKRSVNKCSYCAGSDHDLHTVYSCGSPAGRPLQPVIPAYRGWILKYCSLKPVLAFMDRVVID